MGHIFRWCLCFSCFAFDLDLEFLSLLPFVERSRGFKVTCGPQISSDISSWEVLLLTTGISPFEGSCAGKGEVWAPSGWVGHGFEEVLLGGLMGGTG